MFRPQPDSKLSDGSGRLLKSPRLLRLLGSVAAVLNAEHERVVLWVAKLDCLAQGVKLPRLPEGRTRYLSPTELKAVVRAAPEWMRPPLALAAFTGMRRGELLGLRWVDVDINGRRVYLRETKNGSLRVLALNELALTVLASLPPGAPGDTVMPDVDPQKLSVYTRRLFAGLGIAHASFHSLRHTAASWLVMQGVDLYAVGQLLGHRTPRMTQRYAHLSPQYMVGAVGKLDTVFGNVLPETAAKSKGLQNIETAILAGSFASVDRLQPDIVSGS